MKVVNSLFHLLLKVMLNIVGLLIVCTLVLNLCQHLVPSFDFNALDPLAVLKSSLQFLPRIGELVDLLLSTFGISLDFTPADTIGVLSEISFALLLAIVYRVFMWLHLAIRKIVDSGFEAYAPVILYANMICYALVVVMSVAATFILNIVIQFYLERIGYTLPAALLIAIIIGLVIVAVRFQKHSNLLQFAKWFLVKICEVTLVATVTVLMSCLPTLQYATTTEQAIIIPCLILALLALTCYLAYTFAHTFK